MRRAAAAADEPAVRGRPTERRLAYSVAVVGNPNTGKSTLFNALTGLRQHVGNYPGVTVEHKTGTLLLDGGTRVELIDLPGTYSLAARSPDEMIVADVLVGRQPGAAPVDAVLAIADAGNLERNFYLISQLCELGLPVVVALNMMDVAARQGVRIDTVKLAAALGTPVIGICANKGAGLPQLRAALRQALQDGHAPTGVRPAFPPPMCHEVDALLEELDRHAPALKRRFSRMEALRTLVDGGGCGERWVGSVIGDGFCQDLEARRRRASRIPLAAEEVRARYAWAKQVLAGAVERPAHVPPAGSNAIDRVLTHRFAGTVVFVAVMLLLFQSIFRGAQPLMGFISGAFDSVAAFVGGHMADGALKSLLCKGVIGGLGGVLVFLPQICVLFLFIAVLEDCGYMARAAFLMDRLLACVGLSGKSFIPMLAGFACAVPAVMATRTIENRRDRLTTILITPLVSCSARLPVYAILIAAFIPDRAYVGGWLTLRGLTLFALYCLGIVVAAPVAWLLKKTLLRGETPPFLMELPSYRIPDWRSVALRVYDRGKAFTVRAGTVIIAVSVVVWALSYFPHPPRIASQYEAERNAVIAAGLPPDKLARAVSALNREETGAYLGQSCFGRMGRALEPVCKPLGWDWRITMSVLASFPAREVIVATLGTVFDLGGGKGGELQRRHEALANVTWSGSNRRLFNVPVALSIMVFFALCSQCAATLATIRRETNSWRWPLFSFTYMTLLAYVGALITYQTTMALRWGGV
ncbi:MAG: ferrous iron transport protein B [Planctomycetota bacterium]|nr:ferrous iron transport protein B [Planctomycetota bacterium]